MYQLILNKSYATLTAFEEFRKLYSSDIYLEKEYLHGKNCAWCKLYKKDFDESDLENVCSLECHYNINMQMKLPNTTGFEFDFIGKHFHEIKKLNKFVLTTASTNYPDDPTFQEMFLMFYTTKEIADSLLKYVNTLDCDYDYVYCDKKTKDVRQRINLMDIMKSWNDGEWSSNTQLCDYFGDYGSELNTFIDNELVFVYLIDNSKSRRTLYSILLEHFERGRESEIL